MEWIQLTQLAQLDEIRQHTTPVIIFKHSTRCPVSRFVKKDFEIESILIPSDTPVYLLDILNYRELSNEIAERWSVRHESPQALLIQGNHCLYDVSHNHIRVANLVTQLPAP